MSVYNILFLAIAAAAVIPPALAQQAGRPSPADPAATVPTTRYESAFAGYVPYQEQEVASWRGINDEAARIGGHIGILRNPGNPAAGPASPSPAKPVMPANGTGR